MDSCCVIPSSPHYLVVVVSIHCSLSNFICVCCFLKSWLRTYGYLSQASRQMSTMQSAQILSSAIKDMQRFYGLEVTGHMDLATLKYDFLLFNCSWDNNKSSVCFNCVELTEKIESLMSYCPTV